MSKEPKSRQWYNLFLYNYFWQNATFVWLLWKCGFEVRGLRLLQSACVSVCRPVCLPAGSLYSGLHICLHVPFSLLLEWIEDRRCLISPKLLTISSASYLLSPPCIRERISQCLPSAGIMVCITTPGVCEAGSQTQGFLCAREALH